MTLCTLKSYESRFKNICHCCFSKTYVMFEILAILWIFSWNWNPRKIFQIRTVSNKITVCKINISIQPRFFVNLLISKKHSDLQNKYLIIYPYLGQNVKGGKFKCDYAMLELKSVNRTLELGADMPTLLIQAGNKTEYLFCPLLQANTI